jgi:hypothetical protein
MMTMEFLLLLTLLYSKSHPFLMHDYDVHKMQGEGSSVSVDSTKLTKSNLWKKFDAIFLR